MFCISVDPNETATGTPLVYGPYSDEDLARSDWEQMGLPHFGVLPLRQPPASNAPAEQPPDERTPPEPGSRLQFNVLLRAADGGGYCSEIPLVPGAGSQGQTIEETVKNTRESLMSVLLNMKERGESIPQLADADRWVNLRIDRI